jgi:tRNA(fMet)-specific endonuclease VapC
VNYLLDTNAVVALLRNKPAGVRERYREAEASKDYLALSSVVLFELWYGVAKSSHVPENTERLRILLSPRPPARCAQHSTRAGADRRLRPPAHGGP